MRVGLQRSLIAAAVIGLCIIFPRLLAGAAETSLATIELTYLTADALIPVVRPLLGPEEAISGSDHLVFLRARAVTLEQVRQLVAKLDRAPAVLLVSVRSGRDMRAGEPRVIDNAGPGGGEGGQESVRAAGSRRFQTADLSPTQQLKVLEGHTAFIAYGQSVPYPTISSGAGLYGERQLYGLDYRELSSGFTVVPRLQNGQLLLDIGVRRERISAQGGGIIDTAMVQTALAAELGQWVRLGGHSAPRPGGEVDRVRSTGPGAATADSEVWVRVERLD